MTRCRRQRAAVHESEMEAVAQRWRSSELRLGLATRRAERSVGAIGKHVRQRT